MNFSRCRDNSDCGSLLPNGPFVKDINMKINLALQKMMAMVPNEVVNKKQENGKNSGTSNVPAKDEVSISRLIHFLNQSLTIDGTSTVRSEKVSALKSEIETGTYSVNGQAVAEKMLGKSSMIM